MLKRELKSNFKSFVIWSLVTISIYLLVFILYPSIVNSSNMTQMNELMALFPEEILKAFNMDISSIDSAFGWLKSEGFIFILLIVGCYASILGSNIILKEENDKTIEYLNSLPVSRNNILFNKVIVSLFYIFSLTLVIGIFNYFGLMVSGEFDKIQYILLSITPLFSALPLFFISLFISTFTHKSKKMIGVSLGIVMISYILQTFSTLAESVEFLKYVSVFTLCDIRNVILNTSINYVMPIVSILISILFMIFTIVNYNNKELV